MDYHETDDKMALRRAFFTKCLGRSFEGEVLSKAVDRVIENQDRYYTLLRSTGEAGIESLISSIHKSSFFSGRSHSHHHYASGLVEHSLGVYDQMIRLNKEYGFDLDEKDIILTALLHDICMAKNVEWPHEPGRHGKNSRLIAEKYLPKISDDVKEAIERHRHWPTKEEAARNPLWYLVRNADIGDAATSPDDTLKFMELELGHKDEVMKKYFNKKNILSLLKSTHRKNILQLTEWLFSSSFFDAPASKSQHNVFRGGLAKHSLDVYQEALDLNKSLGLPLESITICALLHDLCKYDQYYIDRQGKPQRNPEKIKEGHGIRSRDIITKRFGVPLTHDEEMAIWWHMGQYEESKDRYPKEYDESRKIPLVQLLCKADGIAAAKSKNSQD